MNQRMPYAAATIGVLVALLSLTSCGQRSDPGQQRKEKARVRAEAFAAFSKAVGATVTWPSDLRQDQFAFQFERGLAGRIVAMEFDPVPALSALDIDVQGDSATVWITNFESWRREFDLRLASTRSVVEELVASGGGPNAGVFCAFRVKSVRHRVLGHQTTFGEDGPERLELTFHPTAWSIVGELISIRRAE